MVYLIDASVYIFRAWYSLPPDLRDADGNPTHALYGFGRFIGDLIERRQPRYLAVAFDESHGSGHRHALFPAYKANREPAPPELKRQFALCREFCRHLGVSEFASPEFEADDLIGTLATRVRAEGLRVTLVTRDKDLSQLVGPGDRFWDYSDAAEYAYEEIAARFGVAPERMADYLALRGDAVDNIPGVPGSGRRPRLRSWSATLHLMSCMKISTPWRICRCAVPRDCRKSCGCTALPPILLNRLPAYTARRRWRRRASTSSGARLIYRPWASSASATVLAPCCRGKPSALRGLPLER